MESNYIMALWAIIIIFNTSNSFKWKRMALGETLAMLQLWL